MLTAAIRKTLVGPLTGSVFAPPWMSAAAAGAVLAFHALTPDDTTFEMLGVKTGTGDLTTTHTSDLYAPDHENVQRLFGTDEPVWSGGRVVENKFKDSNALDTASWTVAYFGAKEAGAGPDGQDIFRWDIPAAASNLSILRQIVSDAVVGDTDVSSFWIKTDGRSTGLRLDLHNGSAATITVDGTWKRYTALNVAIGTSGATSIRTLSTSEGPLYIMQAQIENVTGQSNQNPSEYIATTTAPVTKAFANQNGNTVLNNVVTEAVGVALPAIPYLQYYPAATNSILHSRQYDTTWTLSTGTIVADQVGIDGTPNTGWTLTTVDSNSNLQQSKSAYVAQTCTLKQVIRLGGTGTDMAVRFIGSVDTTLRFNPQTGAFSSATGGEDAYELIVSGDVLTVFLQVTQTSSTTAYFRNSIALPAGAQTVNLLQSEWYDGKTIAEVRGLGPIFTTTAAVSTDRTVYEFEAADSGYEKSSSWYSETEQSSNVQFNAQVIYGASDISAPWSVRADNIMRSRITGLSASISIPDWLAIRKLGSVYVNDDQIDINVDGNWGTPAAQTVGTPVVTYVGGLASRALASSFKLRELQRFDITSYQNGKDIIDGLMA